MSHNIASYEKQVKTGQGLIIFAVSIGTFMSALDSSVVNIALPSIGQHFNVSLSTIEWVVMSYLLIISSLLLTYGRLGDIYGHKKIYIIGFIIFTIGSLACGAAPTIILLILSRALQAVGAGMLMSMGPAIITEAVPPEKRGKSLGINAIAVSVALTTGPVLGGILTSNFGWQSIFYINIPVGIIGSIFAMRVIPENRDCDFQPFDIAGAIVVFLSLISILLSLSFTEKYGWNNPYIISSLIGGVFLLLMFILIEKHTEHPMVDLTLFHNRLFSMSNLSALLNFMAQFSVTLIMPFYLQELRNLPPSKAGLMIIPMPVTTMVIAPVSGAISDKVESRYISSLGMAITTLGIWLLSRLNVNSSTLSIVLSLSVVGLGSGMFQTPNNSAIMGSVPGNRRGIASGFLATMRNIGMVLGVAISGAIFTSRFAYLKKTLSDIGLSGIELNNRAFTGAMHLAYTTAALLAAVAVITSLIRGPLKPENNKS